MFRLSHYRILWSVVILIVALAWFARLYLDLEGVYNSGVAFSIPVPTYLIYILMAGLILWVIYWHLTLPVKTWMTNVGAGLVIGGGLSNLLERVMNDGKVWDYFTILPGGYFNLADVAVISGIIILIYQEIKYERPLR